MTTYTVPGSSPPFTLKQSTSDTLTVGSSTNSAATVNGGTSTPILLDLSGTATAAGILIQNYGTITATARVIDVSVGPTASGVRFEVDNYAGATISSTAATKSKGDLIRSNFDLPSGTVIINNQGTMSTNVPGVNDSIAVRFGVVYSAKQISITNGSSTNTAASIATLDADDIRPGGVNPTSSTTAFGSSTVTNYGSIVSTTTATSAALSKINGIDIGAGQASTVNNYGTITGAESGLGADNSFSGTANFAPTYYVTNNVGATITGNNGPGIAIGSSTATTGTVSSTSTITNYGKIYGKATITGVSANGTGIYSAYAVTIVNGSATNATALIEGQGIKNAPTPAQQGSATTYYAINVASGTIINYGIIDETTATAAGAAINFTGTTGSTVTNYGAINGANGLAIQFGNGTNTLNLYTGSSETGTVVGGTGTDTLTLNLGASTTTGTLAGVSAFEVLSVVGGTWTLADSESYSGGITIGTSGVLNLAQSAALTGSVTDNGSLTFADTGAFNFGNAISGSGTVVQNGAGTLTLSGPISGSDSVSQNGSGTLTLSGTNSYSGGTNLNSGALDVATSAGTGAITFGATAATLDIEQAALTQSGSAYSFTNTIANVGTGSVIDLRQTGTETSVSFNSSTNQLTLAGAEAITLQLNAASAPPAGYSYGFTSDGAGGTDVALDQIATVTRLSTTPSSGYATANQKITIYVTLSKTVTVAGAGPTLTLSDGGTAAYNASESNGTTLAFDTTVAAGQNAPGVQITSIANAGTAQDSQNVPADFSKAINQTPIAPTIDASTPIVTISNAGGLTNQPTQTISGTVNTSADPETAGSTVSVLDGGNTVIGTAMVGSGGAWSTTVTLSGNGQHNLTASDTDAAGNVGTSNTVTYTLDTTTPTVTISNAGGVTNQASQMISGTVDTTADPQTAGTTVTVLDNNTPIGSATVNSNGSWSLGSPITLVNGQNVLSASDTDNAGNTGTSNLVTYTLDTATPSVSISNAGGLTNQASQTIAGTVDTTADPYTAGTTVTVYDNNVSVGTATVGSNGNWTTSSPITLSNGQNVITAKDTDQAGNTGTSNPVTYTLDTATPSVAISSAGGLTNKASQTIAGTVDTTADPYTAGTTVTVYDNNVSVGTATVGSNGNWTTSSPITLSNGQNVITAKDTDQAGNTGTSNPVTYTLDTATPSVAISSAGGLTNKASQTITGTVDTTADPYTAGTTVTVYDNNTAVGTATVGSNGRWSTSSAITLSNGQNVITAKDTDQAGNTGTSNAVTYTLDTTPPSVAITSPGGTVSQAVQTISGTVDVADAGTTVTVFEGMTTLGTALVGANGGWETSVTLQNQGQNTVYAQDTDTAGNTGTSNSVAYDVEPTTNAFTKGNLVISLSGDTDDSGDYTDNQATPAALEQITTSGTLVSTLILPQSTTTINGVTNYAFSSEYGSSSEGSLQLSVDGKSLVIAGYGINAQTYNTGGASVYGNAALAQSTSLTTQSTYTPIGRVIADISSTGAVDTSTELYNIFNTNNPRSVATVNGSSFYISGQGVKGDTTQGLYYTNDGSSTFTQIYDGTDTRTATIYNGVLYVSTDSKQPASGGGTSNISSYGGLPTTATSPTILQGISKQVTIDSAQGNTINSPTGNATVTVNLDPENFFFANANTLYVADGGIPKEGGVGDGGLQKWSYTGSTWVLDYTLSQGLSIVSPGSDEGTTGLIGLTGKVVGNTVELYATNETVGDLDPKYVFSIADQLDATSAAPAGESFTTIYTAPDDTNVRGIAFAPSTQAPTVAITSSGGLTNQPTQTISGTVDVADAGTTVDVIRNGATIGTALVGVDGTWSASVTLAGGTNVLTASDSDQYGNTGTSNAVTYTLDTATPSVTIANAGGPTNQASQAISGSVDTTADPYTIGTTVTVFDNNVSVGTATVGSNGSWSLSSPITLSNGQNTITASDTDTAGNTGTSNAVTYTLDTATPSVTIANAGGPTNQASQTISGTVSTADPEAAGSTVTVYDNNTAVGTATVGSDGSWSLSSPITLGNGQNSITASDTDLAGNTGTSGSVTYTLQTAAPSVTIANAGGPTNQASQAISGTVDTTADPTAPGTTVTVFDNATSVGTATVGSNGSWTTSSAITLANGQNVITAKDTDKAGNIGTSKGVTYTLDTATPSVIVSNAGGLTNQASQTISGTVDTAADPETAGTTVTVYDNNAAVGTATVSSNGNWTTSSAITLSNGQNAITASDTDKAGNTGTSNAVTYTLDTTTPSVTVSNAGGLTNQAIQAISGTVNTTADPYTIGTTVTVYDNNTAVGTATVGSDGSWTTSSAITLSNGQNVITASDTDKAGNTGTSNPVTYTLDTATPSVTISNAGGLTNQASQTIAGTVDTTADPYTAGTTVTVFDNTTAVGTATVGSNGSWTTSSAITLSNGQNVITASDTDKAGNTGTSKGVTYTLDTATPSVTISNAGGPTKQASQAISGTVNTSADPYTVGTTVTVFDNSNVVGTATVGSNGSWSLGSPITLVNGQNSITAKDTDQAGNTGTSNAVTYTLYGNPSITGLANSTTNLQSPTQPFASATVNDPTPNAADMITIALSGAAGTLSGSGLTANADGTYTLGTASPAMLTSELDALAFTPSPANGGAVETTRFDLTVTNGPDASSGTASVTSTITSTPNAPLFGSTTTDVTSAAGEVYALYQTILGRAPDPVGFEAQVAAVEAGTSLQSVAQGLLTSAEYAQDYGSTVASNSGFINQLYEDGLHRPADAGGQQAFGNQLANGTSRAQVAVEIATSQESQNDLAPTFANGVFVPDASDSAVARLYYGLFGRAPDAAGLQSQEMAVGSGTSIGQVIQGMLGSSEYQATTVGQDNLSYIEGLYQTALGRPGDTAGLHLYETGLDTGSLSRAQVADDFLTGTEFQSDEAGQSNASYINAVYEAALGRAADSNGSTYWQTQLANGVSRSQMAEDIVGSAEFDSKYTAPGQAEFVQALYEGALGRAPAASETQAWQAQLSSGTSLASVAASIVESPEAITHLAPKIEAGFHIA